MTTKELNTILEEKLLHHAFAHGWQWTVLHAVRDALTDAIPDFDWQQLYFTSFPRSNELHITYQRFNVFSVTVNKHKITRMSFGRSFTDWEYSKIRVESFTDEEDVQKCLDGAINRKIAQVNQQNDEYNRMKQKVQDVLRQNKMTKTELLELTAFVEKHKYSLDDSLFAIS